MYEISIVMNTYRPKDSDRVDSIKRTIQSVLGQKKVDVQFIIVDDGSPEALKESVVKDVEYYYIKRSGRNIARNLALSKCKTPCVSTTGDDDSLPDNLSLYNRVKHFYTVDNPCAIWTRGINVYDNFERVCCPRDNQVKRYNEKIPLNDITTYTHHAGTLLISTKYIKKYKLDLRWCSEADLLYRIMKIGKLIGEGIYSFPEVTFRYRVKSSKYYKSFPLRLKLLDLVKLYYPYYNLDFNMIQLWRESKRLREMFPRPCSALGKYPYVKWYHDRYTIHNYYDLVTHHGTTVGISHNLDWLYHKTNDEILNRIDYIMREFKERLFK